MRDGVAGAVAALWMLYHLDEPRDAIAEARRVLRIGRPLRGDDDGARRLAGAASLLRAPEPTPFDAEEAPDIVAEVFGAERVEVDRWDGPFVVLPDAEAVATYLRGRGISADGAAEVAASVATPFTVTKRGVAVWGRK